jgi:hypothetical protein
MDIKILNAQFFRKKGINDMFGVIVPEHLREKSFQLIDKCIEKHAGYGRVEIATPRRIRTTGKFSQNHHLNGHITQICNETGNDFEQIKLYIKRKAMGMGFPPKVDLDGNIIYSLVDGEALPQSEADSTVEECAILIEAAHIVAGEAGIILIEE